MAFNQYHYSGNKGRQQKPTGANLPFQNLLLAVARGGCQEAEAAEEGLQHHPEGVEGAEVVACSGSVEVVAAVADLVVGAAAEPGQQGRQGFPTSRWKGEGGGRR